jgi:signal transduction histidine kinase
MSELGEEAVHEKLLEAALQLMSERVTTTVLQRVVEIAAELADARYGALGVVGDDGRITRFLTTGLTPEERTAIGPLPEGHGILGALIKDPRPLRLKEISSDPRSVGFPPNHPPMSSFLGAPVEARGQVFGNIYLTEKRGAEEFTETDERTLILLAAHAGVAIENARLFEANRKRERRLEAIREISTAILEDGDTGRVLSLVTHEARELTDADLAIITVPAGDGESLAVATAEGRGSGSLVGTRFPLAGSLSGEVTQSGKPLLLTGKEMAERDFRAARLIFPDRHGPGMFVPLAAGGRVFGTLVVVRWDPAPPFSEGDLRPVESLAAQAALALEYGRTQDQLRRLAVLDDRERIARDLHDGAIQSLFAVGMSLQATAAMVEAREVGGRIGDAVAELDSVILELRSYIFGLRTDLAGRHLDDTLRELASEFQERSGVVTVVDIDRDIAGKLQPRAGDMVQLAREALSNVGRHAEATTCRLSLLAEREWAMLEVDDDGRGFDPAAKTSGMGLRHLRERVARLGGEIEVRAGLDSGTCVRVLVPL